jgi:hypothetical protein
MEGIKRDADRQDDIKVQERVFHIEHQEYRGIGCRNSKIEVFEIAQDAEQDNGCCRQDNLSVPGIGALVDQATAIIRDKRCSNQQEYEEMARDPVKIETGNKKEEVLVFSLLNAAQAKKDRKEKNDKEKTREQHDGFVPAFLCFTDSKSQSMFPYSGNF